VLVILPLLVLLAPPEQRAGWLLLDWFPLSFLAAAVAVLALRSALRRIPVPAGAPDPSFREAWLERALRWLLVLVSILGTAAIAVAAAGVKAWRPPAGPGPDTIGWELAPFQSVFLAVLPLFFGILGARMWRDLASARRRRAEGLPPLPLERPSSTGDERLDELLVAQATARGTEKRRGKATLRLAIVAAVASALSNLLPPSMQLVAEFSKGTQGQALLEFWRFFTATFVHGDVVSLAVGILTFLAVAPIVEALLGGKWLTAVFLGGGVFATVASFVFVERNYMGMTGADAAVAGFLLFFGLLHRHRLPPGVQQRIAARCLTVLVIVAFSGVLMPAADTAAHLGGFAFGMLLSPLARPRAEVREAMERARTAALATPAT